MALNPTEQALFRLQVFTELEMLNERKGGFLSTVDLLDFTIRGSRFPLIDRARGIRNPRELDATLSIVSAHKGPYDDHIDRKTGILRYKYQGTNPFAGDNIKLRKALETNTPIILFEKPIAGLYVPVVPVIVIGEDLDDGCFIIGMEESARELYKARTSEKSGEIDQLLAPQQIYIEQSVRRRVHQPVFRAQVVQAYTATCAICRLKHVQLLDAAHIIPDADPQGRPEVTNGLCLCKIHHAAYDQNMVGIDGRYRIHVNHELLQEVDGPMLKHGIQEMHGTTLTVPNRSAWRPDPERLAARFAEFQ